MKAIRTFVFLAEPFFFSNLVNAQSNSSASKTAILFEDSLLSSFRHNDLDQYTNLSYPGVISYYGGKKNFREYIQRARALNNSGITDNITIVQMVRDISEWQCVVQKTSETIIDGKKAQIISYMVGQSKDDGHSWKFFDVDMNSNKNLVYIMPDMSEKLAIPQRQVIFLKSGV